MLLEEYLQERIQNTIENGVTHVAEEFSKRYEDLACVTIPSLVDWSQEVARKMLEAESFSLEHCYWWSLHGHLTDFILHGKLLQDL